MYQKYLIVFFVFILIGLSGVSFALKKQLKQSEDLNAALNIQNIELKGAIANQKKQIGHIFTTLLKADDNKSALRKSSTDFKGKILRGTKDELFDKDDTSSADELLMRVRLIQQN